MSNHRPDLFVHTINNLRRGNAAEELSEKLHECIIAARDTGKMATLNLSIKIKPDGPEGKTFFITETATTKVPELDKGHTLMFATSNGDLTRQDPDQGNLELRSVGDDETPIRKAGGE